MAKGGQQETAGGGFSFEGHKHGKVDSKEFGQTMLGDTLAAHKKGPRVFDENLYAGMGEGTKGSINAMLASLDKPVPGLDKATDFASDSIDEAGKAGIAEASLGAMARGANIGASNPHRERILDETEADINARFNGSGRYGSDVHVDTLADNLNSARSKFYQEDLNNQFSAINTINAEKGQRFNKGMSAASAVPTFFKNSLVPGQQALALHKMIDADKQAQLMGRYDLHKRKDPVSHLMKTGSLLSMLRGQPGTEPQKEFNPLEFAFNVGAAIL